MNIYGTHDEKAFMAALDANNGIVVSLTKVSGAEGMTTIRYQLPNKNIATKTVFDPVIYPRAEMTKMAQSASQSAINQYIKSGATVPDLLLVNVGGIQWKVAVAPGPGGIPNVKTAYPAGAAPWP